jgi:ADP-ribose pyrophosphatase YjhB (NUDIX family)
MGIPEVTRPCAFVFLRSGDRVLVSEMVDEFEGTFYRPPGGGIEFGEHSRAAAAREMREEFDLDLQPDEMSLLGVIENAFEFRGAPHHEICFVYEARVEDSVLDGLDGAAVDELAPVDVEVARVLGLADLLALSPLYPDGVKGLLSRTSG